MTRIAAVLLAAGLGSRYRAADPSLPTKLVAPAGGMPMVRRVALAASGSRADPIVVVTGHAAPAVRAALDGLTLAFAHNGDHASGMASSLRTGLLALPADVDGALVLLGDMPAVTPPLLDRLIAAFAADPSVDALVPTRDGRRGNPALLSRALFQAAATLTGDEGARRLLARGRVAEVEVGDPAVLLDVDEPAGLGLTGIPPG